MEIVIQNTILKFSKLKFNDKKTLKITKIKKKHISGDFK